jgi:hypothetical protein
MNKKQPSHELNLSEDMLSSAIAYLAVHQEEKIATAKKMLGLGFTVEQVNVFVGFGSLNILRVNF